MAFQNYDLVAFLSIFYVFSRTDLGELFSKRFSSSFRVKILLIGF